MHIETLTECSSSNDHPLSEVDLAADRDAVIDDDEAALALGLMASRTAILEPHLHFHRQVEVESVGNGEERGEDVRKLQCHLLDILDVVPAGEKPQCLFELADLFVEMRDGYPQGLPVVRIYPSEHLLETLEIVGTAAIPGNEPLSPGFALLAGISEARSAAAIRTDSGKAPPQLIADIHPQFLGQRIAPGIDHGSMVRDGVEALFAYALEHKHAMAVHEGDHVSLFVEDAAGAAVYRFSQVLESIRSEKPDQYRHRS